MAVFTHHLFSAPDARISACGDPRCLRLSWQNLSDDERIALLRLLRETIATDPYPLSPRVRRLKSVLEKRDQASAPPPKAAEPVPAPAPYRPSLLAQRKKQRRR